MMKLDGWQVPGYGMKINCGVKLASEDMSGFGSFSLSADQGVKAAVLSVTTHIPFVDKDQLAELVAKAKELDENGARVIRIITNDVAAAFRVRQAKFEGEIKANEDDDVHAWIVEFKLLEVLSVSEREQQQLDQTALENTQTQTTDGHNNVQSQFEDSEGP